MLAKMSATPTNPSGIHLPLNLSIPMKKSLFTCFFFPFALVALHAQNWQPMAVGVLPDAYVVFSISAVGDNVVWAVASQEIYQGPIPGTYQSHYLRSSDGGQSWSTGAIEEAAGTISFQIVAVDSLTAWITTQDYNSGPGRALYQTTDGGITWVKKHTATAAGVALNRFPDGQHWLAHNRQAISKSSDNGTSWINSTFTGYQTNEFQLLNSGANMSCTVGDTLWSGTSAGRILRMTNYGQSQEFITTTLGTGTEINSIAFQDHLNGLCWSRNAVGNNRIARSMDGGATWSVLAQQPGSSTGWNVAAVPGAPGFYVLASNYNYSQGKVAITTNFGNSWSVENLNQSINSVVFTSPSTGWIGVGKTASATQPSTQPHLYKYSGAPLVGVRTPAALAGLSVAPNPASGHIRFDFEDSDSAQNVLVTITDAAGQVVFSGTTAGRQLDVSTLPAGAFFLTIVSDGKTGVAAFVKQ